MVHETHGGETPHLVLGGARSGKSRFAEKLITAYPPPYLYVATAEILDEEMRLRVDHHRRRRGKAWETIECPLNLVPLLNQFNSQAVPVLVDCLTLWMSNLMLQETPCQPELLVDSLSETLLRVNYPLVLVSNEVGCGIVPDNPFARRFRDLAGIANQKIAAACRRVTYVAAGLPLTLK